MACLPAAGLADIVQSGGETFQYVTLSDPRLPASPGYSVNTLAYGINNLGEIVGYAYTNGGDFGFTYSAGQFSPPNQYAVAGFDSTDIYGVNNAGTLVGSYYNQTDASIVNAYLVANGVPQLNDLPQSEYFGINNSGGIVGTAYAGAGNAVTATGFLQNGSTFTPIGYPGALTYPHGVNDNGVIAGFYVSGAVSTAFQTTAGCTVAACFTTLGLPGASSSFAYGINDSGIVVGGSEYAAGISQGFLYNAGAYTVFDIPGAVATYVTGINDQDQFVGWYVEPDGTHQSFVASQVPEPSLSPLPAAMLLSILAGIGFRAKRRSLAKQRS